MQDQAIGKGDSGLNGLTGFPLDGARGMRYSSLEAKGVFGADCLKEVELKR